MKLSEMRYEMRNHYYFLNDEIYNKLLVSTKKISNPPPEKWKDPCCYDSRKCKYRSSDKCMILNTTYKTNGACPFCKVKKFEYA